MHTSKWTIRNKNLKELSPRHVTSSLFIKMLVTVQNTVNDWSIWTFFCVDCHNKVAYLWLLNEWKANECLVKPLTWLFAFTLVKYQHCKWLCSM